jgi:hypothetical protein
MGMKSDMGMKSRLARTPAIAVIGLLVLLGPASLAGAGTGTGTAAGPGTGTSASRTSAVPAVPSPGVSSGLESVTCGSASDCWAVGSYTARTTQRNEALHWDGSSWSKIPTPDFGYGSGHHSSLAAVACTSAGNCWAVGSYDNGTTQRNEALHWNGSNWSKVATPDPGIAGSGAHGLNGVSCVSRANCWAAGIHISDRGIGRNAVLHWNGAAWSAVTTPQPGENVAGDGRQLSAVTCTSASDCWAVGGYVGDSGSERDQALRWNGAQWLKAAARDNGALSSVACTSAAKCWAVRGQASGRGAVRWNGARWSAVTTPNGAELNGVACTAAASCVAVGNQASPAAVLNDILSWNGISWSAAAAPDPGGTGAAAQNRLAAVACTSAARCWAVGSYWDSGAAARRNVILRWNGHAWTS